MVGRRADKDSKAGKYRTMESRATRVSLRKEDREAAKRMVIPPGAKLQWSDELNRMVWK